LMYPRKIALSVALTVMVMSLLLQAAAPAAAQEGFEFIPLSEDVTNVYGMLGYRMPDGLLVYSAYYVDASNLLVAAGNGYVAGVKVDPAGGAAIVWRQSIIGTATAVTAASYDSSWAAVGSDVGEIVVINLGNPSIRADFYVASREAVTALALNPSGSPVVAALDGQGFLYLMAFGENGWVEIGPAPSGGALKSYYTGGSRISLLSQALLFDGTGYVGEPIAVAVVGAAVRGSEDIQVNLSGLSITVKANVFYELPAGGIGPAITQTVTQEDGTTIRRTLYYAVAPVSGVQYTVPPSGTDTRSNKVVRLSVNPPDLGNTVEFSYVAGPAKLVALYVIEEYDGATGVLASFSCYYAEAPFTGVPGDAVDLGNVIAKPVAAGDFDECVSKVGLNVYHDFTYFQPVMLLRLESPPSQFTYLADAWMTLIPVPGQGNSSGFSDATAFAVFRVPQGSPLAEKGVSWVLVAGDTSQGGLLAVYLLDESWGLAGVEANPLTYYLGSAVTSVAVGVNAEAVYVGTEGGHIYRFLWGGERFYAANSLAVDSEGSITSVREVEGGSFLIAASSNGVVQLVRLSDWKPMWRGLPGFSGVATDISNLFLQGSTLDLLVGFSLSGVEGEASDRIYVFTPGGTDLNPILVAASLNVRGLDGQVSTLDMPEGSYAAIVDEAGKPLAKAMFSGGRALLYAPTGSYTLLVSIESYGQAVARLDVAPPLVSKTYEFNFVEAEFNVYTPGEPPFPEASLAYTLLAGPKEGVTIRFDVTEYYGATEYRPITSSFEVVTGRDGTAVALLWSDTIYTVRAYLEGYHEAVVSFDSGRESEASIEIHPVLYRVTVKAVDAEVYRRLSSEFPVRNAVLTVTLGERSAKVQMVDGSVVAYLARGTYTFIVEAPAYEVIGREVTVAGPTSVTILVEPQRLNVPVTIVLVDEVAGVANGPLPQARVTVELVEPRLDYVFSGVTDENGSVLLVGVRPGVYRITLSDPVVGTVVVDGVEIFGDEEVRVSVKPIYVNVSLSLIDGDLLVPAAGSFTITLYYERIQGAYTSIQVQGSEATLTLPKGIYTIIISSREGYYYDHVLRGEVVSEDATITVPLTPVKVPVTIMVTYNDEETGLASGGVPGALVEIRLVEPQLPYAKVTGITGRDGSLTLVLRAGVYEVTVSSPLTETAQARLTVNVVNPQQPQAQSFMVSVRPLYAVVNVSIIDKEVLKPLPAALLSVSWEGATTTNKKIITVTGGEATLKVPLGRLSFTGILEGYYLPTTLQLNLNVAGETTITILMEPLIVNSRVTVLYEQQVVEINDATVTLPRAPAPNVKVTLIPDDDLLQYLGISPVTVVTGEDGVAVAPLRGGKYRVVLEGYHIEASEASVLVNRENADITVTVKPVLFNVKLTVIDPELREDVGSPESVALRLLSFNGVDLNIELVTGPVIEARLPAGKYRLSVFSAGYAESIQDLTVEGDVSEVVPLKPITREVLFNVTAETVLGVSHNVGGVLLIEAVDIPLKNPVIEVEVRQGQAIAQLRLGDYNVYYSIPEAELTLRVATITVEPGEGQMQVSLTVRPPKVSLALALVDAELEIPVGGATVTIVYLGPLGQYSETVEGVNDTLQMELPPGVIVVDAEAPGYKAARQEIVLKGDRVDAAIRLDPLVYDVQIRLVDQDGLPVEEEVVITLVHRDLPYTREVQGKGPTIEITALRPGSYQVVVTPVNSERLEETQAQVAVEPPGVANPDTIQVNFKIFKVTLTLVDAAKGDTIPFPYTAVIKRVATGAPTPLEVTREVTIQGSAQVLLPYGSYTVTLTPEGPDYYVVDEPFNITVNRDGEIPIKLQPRIYVVTIVVTDDNNRPLANSFVRVTDAEGNEIQSGYTDTNGFFIFRAPFGTYNVTVSHPGFHTAERVITVPQNTNVTISLEPGIRVLLLRYGPLVTGFASLALIAVLIYRMRNTLSERLLKEEEYF